MGGNPKLKVRLDKIRENASRVVNLCKGAGIEAGGVTKGMCGNVSVARAMLEGGCAFLGDSRLKNIAALKREGLQTTFMLLRLPMASEMTDVVSYVDVSLISMPETIKLLDDTCMALGLNHDVIVMVDVGDLREGIWPVSAEIEEMARALKASRKVRCIGVGTNVGCFGGVLPSSANLGHLLEVGHELERSLGYELRVYSGGGTSSLALVEDNTMPSGINQLRIGEAILLGSDITGKRLISYLHQDTLRLVAEVIEVRRKPSVPIGTIGADAFGNVPQFNDRGMRLRAILAIGRQDVRPEGITPLDRGVYVLGASSDHLIVDVEEMDRMLTVGDTLEFEVNYGAMLAAATSPYVEVVMEER